jgi:hypothetical protein
MRLGLEPLRPEGRRFLDYAQRYSAWVSVQWLIPSQYVYCSVVVCIVGMAAGGACEIGLGAGSVPTGHLQRESACPNDFIGRVLLIREAEGLGTLCLEEISLKCLAHLSLRHLSQQTPHGSVHTASK